LSVFEERSVNALPPLHLGKVASSSVSASWAGPVQSSLRNRWAGNVIAAGDGYGERWAVAAS
jgi:hypothetical protein